MFVVIELQENGESLQNIVTAHTTLQEAESKYHAVLAAAAVSAVPVHSAVLLSGNDNVIKSESYRHGEEVGT